MVQIGNTRYRPKFGLVEQVRNPITVMEALPGRGVQAKEMRFGSYLGLVLLLLALHYFVKTHV